MVTRNRTEWTSDINRDYPENSDGFVKPLFHKRNFNNIPDSIVDWINSGSDKILASMILGNVVGPQGLSEIAVYRIVPQNSSRPARPTATGYDRTNKVIQNLTPGWIQTRDFGSLSFDETTQDAYKSFFIFDDFDDSLSEAFPPFTIDSQGAPGADGMTPVHVGNWVTGGNYKLSNIVYHRPTRASYMCKEANIGNSTNEAPNERYWGLLSDRGDRGLMGLGITFKGPWARNQTYNINDAVRFDGITWVCALLHMSTPLNQPPLATEDDSVYWIKMTDPPERGEQGIQGPPGRDGLDSTVPGPQGPRGFRFVPIQLYRSVTKTTDADTITAPTATGVDPTDITRAVGISPNTWFNDRPSFNSTTHKLIISESIYNEETLSLGDFSQPVDAANTGPAGTNGIDGKTIITGDGVPSNTLGNDGDLYYREDVPSIFVKASGSWDSGTVLKGESGTTTPAATVQGIVKRRLLHSVHMNITEPRVSYEIGYFLPTDTSDDDRKIIFELDLAGNAAVLTKYESKVTLADLRTFSGVNLLFRTSSTGGFGATGADIYVNIRNTSDGLRIFTNDIRINPRPLRIFEEIVDTSVPITEWLEDSGYSANQLVVFSNVIYKCLVDNRATPTNRPDVDTTTWSVFFTGSGATGPTGAPGRDGATTFDALTDVQNLVAGNTSQFLRRDGTFAEPTGIQGPAGRDGTDGATTFNELTDVQTLVTGNTSQFLRRDGLFAVPAGGETLAFQDIVLGSAITGSQWTETGFFSNVNYNRYNPIEVAQGDYLKASIQRFESSNFREFGFVDTLPLNASNTIPRGIAANETHIFVADASDDLVYRYTSTGTFVDTFALNSNNTSPSNMALNSTHIFITDTGGGHRFIHRYLLNGTFVDTIPLHANNTGISGIDVTSTHIYVASSRTIYRYTLSGTFVDTIMINNPANFNQRGMFIEGNIIYITNTTEDESVIRVFTRFTLGGNFIDTLSLNTNNTSIGGLSSNSSYIFVLDFSDRVIYRYNLPQGTRVEPTIHLFTSDTTFDSTTFNTVVESDGGWDDFIYQIPFNSGILRAGLSVPSASGNPFSIKKLTFPV